MALLVQADTFTSDFENIKPILQLKTTFII